jgi:hypothetical protein
MFAEVPPGGDAYVLKLILHNWDDESCAKILRNICGRLAPGGRVIAIDTVLPPLGDVSDVPSKLIPVPDAFNIFVIEGRRVADA